ncbi:MAG TPA: D-alanyl-D-alanine carboxypeptidase family protein [Verrucomicrobiae bacterium]|nr:D-alanyl-D-alanine carboxypeptidase family protein [Verrucomicrobiae bacterium]
MFRISFSFRLKWILISLLAAGLVASNSLPTVAAAPGPSGKGTVKSGAVQKSPKPTTKATGTVKKNSKSVPQRKAAKTQVNTGALKITADAAVLIDAGSGQVLYEKNALKRRAPASTTKIMTAILAMEYGNVADVVTVSDKAGKVGQASLHLNPGQKLTLGNLIEGAMIKSGNDACVAIAEHVGGTEETFVRMMNAKAKVLGAHNTQFANTNGLPNSQHYSTAYDLAMIARYGTKIPRFAEITKTREADIEFIEPNSALHIRNTNKLLWMYQFADGVKTGTTNAAGKCLVSSATKNGRQLIAVVLDSPGRFTDSIKLLEYGFNNFKPVALVQAGDEVSVFPIENGSAPEVHVVAGETVEFLALPGDGEKVVKKIIWARPQVAPVTAGEQLGEVQYWLRDRQIGQAQLIATKNVQEKGFFAKLINW